MNKNSIIRIARPTDNLKEITKMYLEGLGFEAIGSFSDHDGFSGEIIGFQPHGYHLEFTQCNHESAGKAPTKDNLLVFYIEDKEEWNQACHHMLSAGFKPVESFNPYWDVKGKTFEDLDGYRVVLQNGGWPE